MPDDPMYEKIDYSAEVTIISNPLVRWIFLAGGTISILLGVIGIFLPLLPTTPFLLLAAYLYSKSSVRYYNWLMNQKRLGPLVRNYHEGKGLPKRAKIIGVGFLWFTICTSAYFFVTMLELRVLLIGIACGVSWHILSLPTLSTSEQVTNGSITSDPIDTKDDTPIEHIVGVRLPVEIGDFHLHLYTDLEEKEHLALVKGDLRGKENVLTRIHSECLTGDLFGSLRCDCGSQLRQAMKMIEEEGEGVVIYLRQEGRGIGLAEKLKAYNLQDQGFDTVDANLKLGHRGEERDYEAAAGILRDLGVASIRLLSNNPAKVDSLRESGISVGSVIPMNPPVTEENLRYLETKVERMDHRIDFNHLSPSTPEREEILRFVKRSMENVGKHGVQGDHPDAVRDHAEFGKPSSEVFTTLSYFQGLEGCVVNTDPGFLAGMRENLLLRGQLRELHDAYLTDSSTFLSLDPEIGKLFPDGYSSLPVIIDPELATPPDSFGASQDQPEDEGELGGEPEPNDDIIPQAILLTGSTGTEEQWDAFLSRNVMVLPIVSDGYQFDVDALQGTLQDIGIGSIVIEGSQDVVTTFINLKAADLIVSTILPCFFSSGTECSGDSGPEDLKGDFCMDGLRFNRLSGELVYYGLPDWKMQ